MPDATSTPPLIVLRGLEGNDPVTLSPMQSFLLPYLPILETAWWCLWFATIAYILVNHVVIPLLAERQARKQSRKV